MKNKTAQPLHLFRHILLLCSALVIFFYLFNPSVVLAAETSPCPPNESPTEIGCLPSDPIQFVTSFYGIGLGLIGGVSMIFIIVGGYTILTSRGSPQAISVGKSYIFYAILGLLLAIFGYIFIEVFLVDILHLPGFSH